MQMPAARVRPGDHLDGAEVLWVLTVPYNETVVIVLDTERPDEAGTTTRLHRYPADRLLEVDVLAPDGTATTL